MQWQDSGQGVTRGELDFCRIHVSHMGLRYQNGYVRERSSFKILYVALKLLELGPLDA